MKIKNLLLAGVLTGVACISMFGSVRVAYAEMEHNCVEDTDQNLDNCSGLAVDDIPEGAEDTNVTYDTFLEAYFANLTNNFGNNRRGSCGYVAMGMLLSYYDTYLCDDIVLERYDVLSDGNETDMNSRRNSPGTMDDLIAFSDDEVDRYSPIDYRDNILALKNRSLHAKLLSIGIEVYKFHDDLTYTTDISKRTYILDYYFQNELNYEYHMDYWYNYNPYDGNENIKQFIKEQIDLGRPALVSVANSSGGNGHACIAYAYEGDTIYFHPGWRGFSTRYTLEEMGYDTYRNAMSITFNKAHSHSNNYKVGDKTYCYCNHDIITYKNLSHSYTTHYTNNGSNHTVYCVCGESIQENHTYDARYSKLDADYHTAFCTCGAFESQSHLWIAATTKPLSMTDKDVAEPCLLPSIGRTVVECYYCHFSKVTDAPIPIPGGFDSLSIGYTIPTVSESEGMLPVFDMRQHDGE